MRSSASPRILGEKILCLKFYNPLSKELLIAIAKKYSVLYANSQIIMLYLQ